MATVDEREIKALLTDAIKVLCKACLRYQSRLTVEGLLGVTLDEQHVFLINLNETIEDNRLTQGQLHREAGTPMEPNTTRGESRDHEMEKVDPLSSSAIRRQLLMEQKHDDDNRTGNINNDCKNRSHSGNDNSNNSYQCRSNEDNNMNKTKHRNNNVGNNSNNYSNSNNVKGSNNNDADNTTDNDSDKENDDGESPSRAATTLFPQEQQQDLQQPPNQLANDEITVNNCNSIISNSRHDGDDKVVILLDDDSCDESSKQSGELDEGSVHSISLQTEQKVCLNAQPFIDNRHFQRPSGHYGNDSTTAFVVQQSQGDSMAATTNFQRPAPPYLQHKTEQQQQPQQQEGVKSSQQKVQTTSQLSNRRRSKDNGKAKPQVYACEFCSKKFTTKAGRFFHKPIHTGEWKFKCDFCGKGFMESKKVPEPSAAALAQNEYLEYLNAFSHQKKGRAKTKQIKEQECIPVGCVPAAH